ncbi:MAG: glycosyltransferase family 2 protein [Limisphaerales bacterium]
MTGRLPQVTVCVCTYRRPALLRRLLSELQMQETRGLFEYSVVVADNDEQESSREVVAALAGTFPVRIAYCTEKRRSIALVRNKALERAKGDFVAFIDDDEFPTNEWLVNLFSTCIKEHADGVLGPVKPHFEGEPPRWLIKAGFYDRPAHPTGFVMPRRECRTGNTLFRRQILDGIGEPFRPEFGIGSEDVDFFCRMIERGHTFVWCDEAPVFESIPPHRWKRSFLIRRALLRGKTALQHPQGRWAGVAKSVIAVLLYTAALPFLLLAGQHHFMKYLVKSCDHAGKLLASVGLSPIREREM